MGGSFGMNSDDHLDQSQTGRLAAVILQDIRQAGFQPGEQYLNGNEIAAKYGVTVITANRALQMLAERNVLERRRRAGTFIAGAFALPATGHLFHCIHLLMPATYFRASRSMVEQAIFGIHSELPESHIHFTFVPPTDEMAFVRQLVKKAKAAPSPEGIVLYVSSAETQQFFRESGLPVVVFGSVFPEGGDLPWVDRDQRHIGQLLAEFLLREKHQRIATLMRDRWGYGDNLLLDGVQDAFAAAKAKASHRVRSVPSIPETAAGMIRSLLKSDEAPTALICRSEALAQVASLVASELKIKVPRQLRIVVAEAVENFPCVRPQISQEEQGAIVGRMLKQLSQGQRPNPDHVLVPVALHHSRLS